MGFGLEIVGYTRHFYLALMSEVPDVSTSLNMTVCCGCAVPLLKFSYPYLSLIRQCVTALTPSPTGKAILRLNFVLEIIGLTYYFNLTLLSELSDVSTTLNMTAQGLSRAFFKESKNFPSGEGYNIVVLFEIVGALPLKVINPKLSHTRLGFANPPSPTERAFCSSL
jgi:hypothetical protein